jgi:hypothetical protein
MGDSEYESEYLSRKERLRKLHQNLKRTKEVQEIYHKIMGSDQDQRDEFDELDE